MRYIIFLSIILINFSSVISADDSIARISNEIKKKSWNEAEKIAKASNDTSLYKYVLSKKYLSDTYNHYSFEEIANFVMQNPSWPYSYTLRTRAERLINKNSDQRAVFLFLSKFSPITANGYKHFAYIANHFVQSNEHLSKIIQDGWINGSFDLKEQNEYLTKFKTYIGYENIVQRIDSLIWKKRLIEANNILFLLKDDEKKLFNARIALQKASENKFDLFDLVPEKYQTNSGLLYDYCYLSRKDDKISDKAINYLLKASPATKENANQWWKLKAYFIRELIREKRYDIAYEIAKIHNGHSASDISEGEFLGGWLSLRFIKNYNNAIKHFHNFNKVVKTPVSIARGNYWLARSYKALGKNEIAKEYFTKASLYSYKLYGMLALHELDVKTLDLEILDSPKPEILSQIMQNERLRLAKKIIKYDIDFAIELAIVNINSTQDFDKLVAIINYLEEPSNVFFNMEISRKASEKSVFALKHLYPIPFKIDNPKIHPAHTYSVIKHESSFNQYAVDPGNDTHGGLMQIIPETACSIAKSIKVSCDIKKLTTHPEYNILLGNSHLYDLNKQYDNSLILVTGAYNAGTHRVKQWIQNFGDPRKINNLYDAIDWIELIPFEGTRNYVQRIMENVQIYNILISKNNNLEIENLIMKGY